MKEYFKTDNGVLYQGDVKEVLPQLQIDSIDLIVSSPPYYNLREYASWETYKDHKKDIDLWFIQFDRILKQGRHICWNIQDNLPEPSKEGRHYYPLMPDTIKVAIDNLFEWERNIVWSKNNATQVMFGSYPYPPNIIYSTVTESICVFRKPGKTDLSNKKEVDKIEKAKWNPWKNNLWEFTPETRSEHPAPFPIELPTRCIILHSFTGDTVLDPFMGSGTTALACERLKRKWIGIEQSGKYCEMIKKRLTEELQQLKLF